MYQPLVNQINLTQTVIPLIHICLTRCLIWTPVLIFYFQKLTLRTETGLSFFSKIQIAINVSITDDCIAYTDKGFNGDNKKLDVWDVCNKIDDHFVTKTKGYS